MICGLKSVPVYNLLEHFLSQFQMWTFNFELNATFSIGFASGNGFDKDIYNQLW